MKEFTRKDMIAYSSWKYLHSIGGVVYLPWYRRRPVSDEKALDYWIENVKSQTIKP